MCLHSQRETQRLRQKDIREEVALVFNMSSMEVNLTGSEQTSGRSTSESQSEIEQGKGVIPILKTFENKITQDLITARYNYGYQLEFDRGSNEMDEVTLDKAKLLTGELTQNELRESKGKPIFVGQQYDLPQGQGSQSGNDELNPQFIKQVD